MEPTKPEPKISTVEVIWIGIALVFVSIINLIPLVGDFTGPAVGGLMAFYLFMKGLWGIDTIVVWVASIACEMIPILQALPAMLLAWIITVFIDRALTHAPKEVREAAQIAMTEGGGSIGEAAEAGKAAAIAKTTEQSVAATGEAAEAVGAGRSGAVEERENGGMATDEANEVTAEKGGGAGEEGGTNVAPEALGEESEPMEKLQEELLGSRQEDDDMTEKPEEDEDEKKTLSTEERIQQAAERVRKAQSALPEMKEGGGVDSDDDEDELAA